MANQRSRRVSWWHVIPVALALTALALAAPAARAQEPAQGITDGALAGAHLDHVDVAPVAGQCVEHFLQIVEVEPQSEARPGQRHRQG